MHCSRIYSVLKLAFIVCLMAQSAFAQKQQESDSLLRLEDFAPKTGNLSTSLGLTYITQRDDAVDVGTVLSPLFPGVFIVLPNVQATEQEQDSVVGSLGLRYGLIPRLNLTARVNGTYRNVRTETADATNTRETGRVTNVSLGADYRVTSPVSQPFVIGFAQVAVLEDSGGQFVYGKTASAGLIANWVKDPLILSGTITYSHFGERDFGMQEFNPGNLVTVSPSVGFAANPDVNLSWGLAFGFRQADTLNGVRQGVWRSLSSVTLGMAYSQSKFTVVNVNARVGVGGNDRTQLSLFVTHRFNQ